MTPQPDQIILSTRDGYDRWAATYDTDGNPLQALEEPRVDELLGEVRWLRVLDVGCGTGRHAIRLASRGAMVHAIDFSAAMLDLARAKANGQSVVFQVHDVSAPLPFAAESFDRVVCGLVIDHVADLRGLFGELHRVCRKSGCVVVSVMHPAMMLKGVQARFRDAQTGRETYPASHPHQISDYCLAAAKAGFRLDQMGEHRVDQAFADRFERARRYLGWPMLLAMRLIPDK